MLNAMLAYPNPASQEVSVAYDYGNGVYATKVISVFDQLGRRIAYNVLSDNTGTLNINTQQFTPGSYIIRMEADGIPLQVQHLVVSN